MARKVMNQVLGHADESDGIEEYDNPLPDWWVGLFWITIVFSAIYTPWYHFTKGKSQVERLAAEMAAAEEQWPQVAAAAATVEMTPEAIAAGAALFATNCTGCHGADLHGGIGPNLVDATWIHGGTPEQVVHTITNGVVEKGMLAWGPILGPQKIAQVAAYVLSKAEAPAAAPAPADTAKPAGG